MDGRGFSLLATAPVQITYVSATKPLRPSMINAAWLACCKFVLILSSICKYLKNCAMPDVSWSKINGYAM